MDGMGKDASDHTGKEKKRERLGRVFTGVLIISLAKRN